jgi:DNA primase
MEIPELKTRLSILEVARNLGIEVDRNGRALCPFHDDKKPSLQFSKEKNICTCFSANCTAGTMDIINLTEKYLKLTTHEAILKLQEWITPVNGIPVIQELHTGKAVPEVMERVALLTKAFRYFEASVFTSMPAKEYLQSRGLIPATTSHIGIEVGYNSGNFHNRSNKNLIATAVKYGLISPSKNSGYNVFGKGCIVFPLKNRQGQITGLYFRETDDKKDNRHYYLKDRQGLYPHYPKPETTRLILTEAIIDAATLLQITSIKTQYSILACYGTNGFTPEHEQAISELQNLEEIIIFFDGDESGQQGSQRIAGQIKAVNSNLKITIVETPQGEDVNSLAQNHPDKQEELFTHLLSLRKDFLFSTETLSIEKKKDILASSGTPKPAQESFDAGNPNRIIYHTETAKYYVKGGLRKELDSMRVSLVIEPACPPNKSRHDLLRYRCRLDLYEAKQVERMASEAAEKLGLRADLIELDLNRLTDRLDDYRDKAIEDQEPVSTPVFMDETIRSKCREFLSRPNLIARINDLIGQAGVVGEENNRIFLFVISGSYKMAETLHALIQGTTGSGKTYLLKKVSAFMPPEDTKHFTRVTDSSLYNYGMYDLKNKLICLEDLDGMHEEAQLALRELQSREMLCSSTTGQDEKGNIRAFERVVYGPIASMACTTRGDVFEDNLSRCFTLAVDETWEQTVKIIAYQNKKSAGQIEGKREQQITEFLQNCMRMLKPYEVVNPYADKVHLPEEAHKIRRLNELYQAFVKQVTLINQYRRNHDKQDRLISEKEDLQVAAEIMFDSIVLKVDELDGSLRLFYERLKEYVKAKGKEHHDTYHFGQREIRHALALSKSQLQRYLNDLVSLEYIRQTGGFANRGFTYKVLYWDNIQALRSKVKRHLQGQLDQLELACLPELPA